MVYIDINLESIFFGGFFIALLLIETFLAVIYEKRLNKINTFLTVNKLQDKYETYMLNQKINKCKFWNQD
jgi:hypothetical protein